MSLHIEINGDCSVLEWQAIAAVAAIMLGADAARPFVPAGIPDPAKLPPVPIATAVAKVPAPPLEADPAFGMAEQLMAAEEARVAAAASPELPAMPPPPPGVEVDVNGLPHDLRIHSAEKTKNKDGSWRVRRGTDKALVAAVEAELKSIMSAPAASATVPQPPSDAVQLDPAAAFGGNAPSPSPSPAMPGTEVPPPPSAETGLTAETAPPSSLTDFARVMRAVVEKQKAGVLSTEQMASIVQQFGLTAVKDLVNRPDLIPAVEALLP